MFNREEYTRVKDHNFGSSVGTVAGDTLGGAGHGAVGGIKWGFLIGAAVGMVLIGLGLGAIGAPLGIEIAGQGIGAFFANAGSILAYAVGGLALGVVGGGVGGGFGLFGGGVGGAVRGGHRVSREQQAFNRVQSHAIQGQLMTQQLANAQLAYGLQTGQPGMSNVAINVGADVPQHIAEGRGSMAERFAGNRGQATMQERVAASRDGLEQQQLS